MSIATFDTYHYEQTISAINNGKHVFVEKPLCLFDHELAGIKDALNKNPHVRLSSNLILRSTPRFLDLFHRIKNGDLGKIYCIEGDYDYGRIHKLTESWRGEIPFYSVVHGGAIHLIDLILWLTGEYPNKIFALGNRISTEKSIFKQQDFVTAIMQFTSGLIAKVNANFGSVTPHGHKLCVYGTKGTFLHGHNGAFYYHSRDPKVLPEVIVDQYPGANKGDMIPSFVEYILDGKKPIVTGKDVLDAMEVSLGIERSLSQHQLIELNF